MKTDRLIVGISTAFLTAAAFAGAALGVGGSGFVAGGGGETLTATAPIVKTGTVLTCNAASGSQAGCLASADFTTFNGKESVLSFSAPLSRSVNTISCTAASGSVNGCLASADFTTFNNKYGSGATPSFGATTITGTTDTVQMTVKGNATQTSDILQVQTSAAAVKFQVSNTGAVTEASTLTVSAGGITTTGTSTMTQAAATDAFLITFKKGGGESTNDAAVAIKDSSNNVQELLGLGSGASSIEVSGAFYSTGSGPITSTLPANYAAFDTGGTGIARVRGIGGTNTAQTLWKKNAPIASSSGEVNGASAEAYQFDTGANLSNATAKLASFKNQGTEKAAIYSNGTLLGIGGLATGGVTAVKTANYTATLGDSLVLIDISGGAFTLTLPAANAAKGQVLRGKCTALHATNRLTVSRAGSDTIQTMVATGATTFSACAAATYDTFELMSDGTSVWYMTNYVGTTVP